MKKMILLSTLFVFFNTLADAQTFTEIIEEGWGQGKANCRPVLIDLDNDGLLGMIIGDNRGILYYYEQDAPNSENFNLVSDKLSNIDVGYGSAPCFTDLDNDGLLDLLIGHWSPGGIQHYEQDAAGSTNFTLISESFNEIDVGEYASPYIADLDHDGLLDMIVGETTGNLNYYEQEAAGSTIFTLITDSLSGIDIGGNTIPCIIDLDNDGLLDMIVGEGAGNLNHYEQEAVGSLEFTLITEIFNNIIVDGRSTPFLIDLDTDGLLDLFVGSSDGYISRYEQDANDPTAFHLLSGSIFKNYDMGHDSSPAVIDLDNNGLLDLIVGERNGYLNHYEQEASGSINFILKTDNFLNAELGGYSIPCFVDVDTDGLLDLFVGEVNGNINHYEQEATLSTSFTLITEKFNDIQVDARSAPCFADFDNNGLLDLIVAGSSSGNVIHYEQVAADLDSFIWVTDSLSEISTGNRAALQILDFDNNGMLDLFVGLSTGNLKRYEQDAVGSATFTLISNSFGNINVGDRAKPAFADVNGDGLIDIFIGELFGGVYYFQQNESLGVFNSQDVELYSSQIRLSQNYPNPFNPSTTIRYDIQKSSHVILKVYNLAGQELETLVNGFQATGEHEITWQPKGLSDGIYIYRLQAGKFTESKKLIFQK
jgi:uncharacterized protein (DUF2141 family)